MLLPEPLTENFEPLMFEILFDGIDLGRFFCQRQSAALDLLTKSINRIRPLKPSSPMTVRSYGEDRVGPQQPYPLTS